MAINYLYKAKDRAGQILTGTVLADDEAAVAAYVREKGYYVTQIKRMSSTTGFASKFAPKPTTKDIALLCRQMSTMIDAGMSLIACLGIMIDQTYNVRLKEALQGVYKNIKEGASLSKSLAKYPTVFPELLINMVEAGELGGVLDIVLERLAIHFEKDYKLNQKVKSAMVYPGVVISMAVLVVVFVLVVILPKFKDVFASMNAELPLPTKILMGISDALINNYIIILLTLVLIVGCYSVAMKKRDFRKRVDAALLVMPILGGLINKIAVARFTRTLATMVQGGVPLITAFEVIYKTTGNLVIMDALVKSQNNLRSGWGLANTLAGTNVFNNMVIQMVSIGEESGAIDTMLAKVADFYEQDVDEMVGRLNSILEPVIIIVLGGIVALIVASVMMPLFDIVGKIG